MSDWLTRSLFAIPGIIHLLPLGGALGQSQLKVLYNVNLEDPNIRILLQHRAVLFGIVGGVLVRAAIWENDQDLSLKIGLASAVPFLAIAGGESRYNECLARVVAADRVAVTCLLGAAVRLWLL